VLVRAPISDEDPIAKSMQSNAVASSTSGETNMNDLGVIHLHWRFLHRDAESDTAAFRRVSVLRYATSKWFSQPIVLLSKRESNTAAFLVNDQPGMQVSYVNDSANTITCLNDVTFGVHP